MSQCDNLRTAQALQIPGLDNRCVAMCVPETSGQPTEIPGDCDSLIQYDPDTGSTWLYLCGDPSMWIEVGVYSNCELPPIDTSTIGDICNALGIPVIADTVAGCASGQITLATLTEHIQECICANLPQSTDEATSAITCGPDGTFIEHPITPLCDQVGDDPTEATSALDCVAGSLVRRPLPTPPPTVLPTCVDRTIGMPTNTPDTTAGDNIFAYDLCASTLWFYTCDDGWHSQSIAFGDLDQLDPDLIADICNTLRIPAFTEGVDCASPGYLTLQDLAEEVFRCAVPCGVSPLLLVNSVETLMAPFEVIDPVVGVLNSGTPVIYERLCENSQVEVLFHNAFHRIRFEHEAGVKNFLFNVSSDFSVQDTAGPFSKTLSRLFYNDIFTDIVEPNTVQFSSAGSNTKIMLPASGPVTITPRLEMLEMEILSLGQMPGEGTLPLEIRHRMSGLSMVIKEYVRA